MTTATTLERERHEPVEAPSWSMIQEALEAINPRESGYVILTRSDGSYMQTAGGPLRLIIEWRRFISPAPFQHFVVGKPYGEHTPASINTSAGIIRLQRNEILSVKNAIEVFQSFYENGTIPSNYLLRDNTAMFANS